jgi:hypothetical protein
MEPEQKRASPWVFVGIGGPAATLAPVLVALLSSACSGGTADLGPWGLPLPDGTPIIQHEAVPVDGRGDRIELVEDLVIGGEGADEERSFYRVGGIAVDDAGNLFVNDAGNNRIQVFDAGGGFVRSFGGAGEGPGEMVAAVSITVAGDRVVVFDRGPLRLTWWRLDGEFLGSAQAPRQELRIFGLPDGSLAATYRVIEELGGEAVASRTFARFSNEGEEASRYLTLPIPWATTPSVPVSAPDLAVGPEARLYIRNGERYEILALDAPGTPRWALRTNWPARAIPADDIRRYEAVRRRRHEQTDPDSPLLAIDWPERLPVLSNIEVDGHGHVYVFPWVYLPLELENPPPIPDRIPVDVYSAEGERLFAGTLSTHGILRGGWDAAWGDFVLRSEPHPETRESQIVRYRLVEPFDR